MEEDTQKDKSVYKRSMSAVSKDVLWHFLAELQIHANQPAICIESGHEVWSTCVETTGSSG